VHCDVTPDNILLDRASGRAIVTDFGIAQANEGTDERSSRPVVGTAYYMSPEQATGRALDGRSDIYSLGIVAWYALTGRLPFTGPQSVVLRKQVHEAPPPLTAVNPHVPRMLAETVHRALAKSAGERFQSAEAFADAIALSIAPQVVTSVPLQIWLAGGDELRYALAGLLGFAGLAVSHRGPWGETLAYLAGAIVGFLLLEILDVRRMMAAGYQLHHLRSALRTHIERRTRHDRNTGDRAVAAAIQRQRRMNIRTLGTVAMALAVASMLLVAVIHRRFSPHALGVAILSIGLLALGRRRVFEPDRVAIARMHLWCSRVGGWLAALAAWRLPTGRRPVIDAAFLLPEREEILPGARSDTPARADLATQASGRDLTSFG
jgi:serine/threonine-protein kinase